MRVLVACIDAVRRCTAAKLESNFTLRWNEWLVGKPGAELEFTPLSNLSIIVSDVDQTVSFQDKILPITKITPLLVGFSSQYANGRPTISGRIDRLTKSVEIDWMYENVGENTHWELKCRPEGPFRDWG